MQDTRRQVQSRLHSRLNHAQVEFMKRLVWQATDAVSSHRRWSKEWKAQCLPSTFWRTQNKTPAQNAKNKWIMLVSGLEWFCTSKMLYIFSLLVYSDRNFIIIIFNNNYMASYVQVCCSLLLSWCCGVQRTAMLVLRGTRDVMNWTITIPCEGVYTSFPFEAIFPWNHVSFFFRDSFFLISWVARIGHDVLFSSCECFRSCGVFVWPVMRRGCPCWRFSRAMQGKPCRKAPGLCDMWCWMSPRNNIKQQETTHYGLWFVCLMFGLSLSNFCVDDLVWKENYIAHEKNMIEVRVDLPNTCSRFGSETLKKGTFSLKNYATQNDDQNERLVLKWMAWIPEDPDLKDLPL